MCSRPEGNRIKLVLCFYYSIFCLRKFLSTKEFSCCVKLVSERFSSGRRQMNSVVEARWLLCLQYKCIPPASECRHTGQYGPVRLSHCIGTLVLLRCRLSHREPLVSPRHKLRNLCCRPRVKLSGRGIVITGWCIKKSTVSCRCLQRVYHAHTENFCNISTVPKTLITIFALRCNN